MFLHPNHLEDPTMASKPPLYAVSFGGEVYTPDGLSTLAPSDVEEHNKRLAEQELEYWTTKPARYFAYVVPSEDSWLPNVTTWTGQQIGRITWQGREFTDNFGGTRRNFTMRGSNGVQYYGTEYTYYGYCRLTAYKHQEGVNYDN